MVDYKNLPVDTEYSKTLEGGYVLPFLIGNVSIKAKRETFEDEAGLELLEINEKIVFIESDDYNNEVRGGHVFYLGIAIMFGVLFPIISFPEELFYFYVLEAIAILFLLIAYRNYRKWKKTTKSDYFVFDREKGEITLPVLKRTSYIKIKFNELKAVKDRAVAGPYQAGAPYSIYFIPKDTTKFTHKSNLCNLTLFEPREYDALESWSFYVWYMDRNRPLPKGQIFDEFREKDFERRKSEGFPAPLYKSIVPTPEATPEQQLIRDSFWKDEDYIVDKKEANYNPDSIKVAIDQYKKKKS